MRVSDIDTDNVRYRGVVTMMDKGQLQSSFLANCDGFVTPDVCYAEIKQRESLLKRDQEKILRDKGDTVSTLDLECNDAQFSITACANDRERGLQLLHMVFVEPYDVTRPDIRPMSDE